MRACTVVFIVAWTTLSAVATAQQREPYVLYRQVQDESDKAAYGASAIDGESENVVERFIASVNSAQVDWSDHRNKNAIVMFLLTGGEARTISGAIADARMDERGSSLIEKSLAFATSDRHAKPEEFAAIDPKLVSPEIAGAVAFAEARQLAGYDRSRAVEKLTVAAILAPGGLIEEAALRQQLFLLDKKTEIERVERIAYRYLGRFPKSRYAENFLQGFRRLVEDIWADREGASRLDLIEMVDGLPPEIRSDIIMRIARSSLLRGDHDGARISVRTICDKAPSSAQPRARCRLYRWLALGIDGSETEAGAPAVDADSVGLSDEDRLLKACADSLRASAVESGPTSVMALDAQPQRDEDPVEARAIRDRMAEADKVLSKAP